MPSFHSQPPAGLEVGDLRPTGDIHLFDGCPVRVWDGHAPDGTPIRLYVCGVAVPDAADQTMFREHLIRLTPEGGPCPHC